MTSEAEESVDNNSGRNAALSLPLAALGFVTRLASGIFSRGRKNVDPLYLDSKVEDELVSQEIIKNCGGMDSVNESNSHNSDIIDNCGGESSHGRSLLAMGMILSVSSALILLKILGITIFLVQVNRYKLFYATEF